MSDEVLPGVIGGRYETVRLIGRGGMGSVWLAEDTLLGRQVALKQIGALPGETAGEAERARREARSAAALNHPNVVALYDAITHEGAPWLVMEYVSGPTLSAWVREHGPLEPEVVAEIGARLAGGLAAAHRAGIVHRDIKPANVFMGDDGEPKLGDFGTARGGGGEDHLTLAGVVTGTPSYMAPEVADGGEYTDGADVWGLGATLYFAVEGADAYPGQGNALATLRSVATRPPRTPERAGVLEPALAQMLTHDPDRRGDMRDVMRRLEGIAPGRPGGIPFAGAAAVGPGALGAGAAAAADDEATNPHFVPQEPDDPSGLFGFPGVPDRVKGPREDRSRRPLLVGLAAAWAIGLAGVAAFTLGDDDGGGEATPSTTTSTSSSSSTSSTTSSTTEPTSETTSEEVVPAPEPTTEAPAPPPEPPPAPDPTTEPPSATSTTPEPSESTTEPTPEPSETSETTSETSEPTETPEQPSETTSEFTQPTEDPTTPTTSPEPTRDPEPTEDPEPTSPSGGRGSSTTPGG